MRIAQPTKAFYEVMLNTFLLLVLLEKVDDEGLFLHHGQKVFKEFWSDDLHRVARFFYKSCANGWKEMDRGKLDNIYQLYMTFILEMRSSLNDKWFDSVVTSFRSFDSKAKKTKGTKI